MIDRMGVSVIYISGSFYLLDCIGVVLELYVVVCGFCRASVCIERGKWGVSGKKKFLVFIYCSWTTLVSDEILIIIMIKLVS